MITNRTLAVKNEASRLLPIIRSEHRAIASGRTSSHQMTEAINLAEQYISLLEEKYSIDWRDE